MEINNNVNTDCNACTARTTAKIYRMKYLVLIVLISVFSPSCFCLQVKTILSKHFAPHF